MKRPKRNYTLFILVVLLPVFSRAGVIRGDGCLGGMYAWDFSDSVAVEWGSDDLLLFRGFDGSGQHIEVAIAPHGLAIIPDSSYKDLSYAPEDLSRYETEQELRNLTAYVVRTAEGNYAKFQILLDDCGGHFHIEYSYQPNGSRCLVDGIAIQDRTWGIIKALYR